ncbi:MAG: heme NO-binding domain-containing protein [Myxococcales bacterium]|jgi:hypothetical protein|nr:heme NO-binding protein [Myxococcales bacterium]HIK85950.1 heme NO-binding protein [Myxococcales bacterium]
MYGLVHRGIKEFLLHSASPEAWNRIRTQAGIADDEFEDLRAYPDEETFALVGAVSQELGQPPEDILYAFGRNWVLFTAESAYGDLLEQAGDTFESVILNLDMLHQIVGRSMPDLRPPTFDVKDVKDGWIVEYHSERVGLESMVAGLLEGLLEMFGKKGMIQRLPAASYCEVQFLVTLTT